VTAKWYTRLSGGQRHWLEERGAGGAYKKLYVLKGTTDYNEQLNHRNPFGGSPVAEKTGKTWG